MQDRKIVIGLCFAFQHAWTFWNCARWNTTTSAWCSVFRGTLLLKQGIQQHQGKEVSNMKCIPLWEGSKFTIQGQTWWLVLLMIYTYTFVWIILVFTDCYDQIFDQFIHTNPFLCRWKHIPEDVWGSGKVLWRRKASHHETQPAWNSVHGVLRQPLVSFLLACFHLSHL